MKKRHIFILKTNIATFVHEMIKTPLKIKLKNPLIQHTFKILHHQVTSILTTFKIYRNSQNQFP